MAIFRTVFRPAPALLAFALFYSVCSCIAASEIESRIWTDKSGKHQIKATFIDFNDGVVRLERPNGNITKIPLSKLSKDDQAYVRSAAKEKRVEKKHTGGLQVGDRVDAKHFRKWETGVVTSIDYDWEQVKVRLDSNSRMDWNFDLDELRYPGTDRVPKLIKPEDPSNPKLVENELKLTHPNESEMLRLVGDGTAGGSYVPVPSGNSLGELKPRAIRLASANDFFEEVSDFSISQEGDPIAAVVYKGHARGHSDEDPSRIEIINLKSRQPIVSGAAPANTAKVYLSPSGKRVATLPDVMGADEQTGQIDFWEIEGKKANHLISFAPYFREEWPDLEVQWFSWLDDDHCLTSNRDGRLLLWQVDGAKAVYELLIGSRAEPLLGHGKKQILIPTNEGIQVCDARSGDQIAQVGDGSFRGAALALSPSGKQLAAASAGYVDVVDLTTGETTRSFPCKGASSFGKLWWIDEQHLFVGSRYVVDIARRIIIWEYQVSSQLIKPAVGTQWASLEDRHRGLRLLQPFDLPPPEAIQAASQISEDDILAIKPGMSISIDVQIGDQLLKQDVYTALEQGLTDAGLKVSADQSLKLVARMTHGKSEEVSYQIFGLGSRGIETFSVTPRIFELDLLDQGISIWKRTSTQSTPHHIQTQRGESIEAAVMRLMKPTASNFRGRLPAYVVKPEYAEPLGSSKLSVSR